MKRLFTFVLAFVICVISFIIPISAESYDSYDSRYITSEEKDILAASYWGKYSLTSEYALASGYSFTKVYDVAFLYFFRDRDDIISWIKQKSEYSHYLVPISTEDAIFMVIRDGKAVHIGRDGGATVWMGFFKYSARPDLVFETSVKVNEIYCFDDLFLGNGACLYYKTDHGDYILYYMQSKEQVYLFPLSDFYEFAKLYDNMGSRINKVLDLESYLINDTPHAVSHPDADSDKKCDVCEITIPEDNEPFLHISGEYVDKLINKSEETYTLQKIESNTDASNINSQTDKNEETDTQTDSGCGGCTSSVALLSVVVTGFIAMPLIIKKKNE